MDTFIEDLEVYSVTISSVDDAVQIDDSENTATITIVDESTG